MLSVLISPMLGHSFLSKTAKASKETEPRSTILQGLLFRPNLGYGSLKAKCIILGLFFRGYWSIY